MATRTQWHTARINTAGSPSTFGIDKRVKLTDDDHARILSLHRAGTATREIARQFEGICSRRMIQFIIDPAKLARQKEYYKERRKDGRYYSTDKQREAIRKHRAHLREIHPELNEGPKPGDAIRHYNEGRKHTQGGQK